VFYPTTQIVSGTVVLTFLVADTVIVADEQSELNTSITTALIDATRDADEDVRRTAFSELESHPKSNAIIEVFRRGLEDENHSVRRMALSKLVELEGATDENLRRLVSSLGDPALQLTAQQHLLKIGEPAVPLLIEAIQRDGTKSSAAYVLGRVRFRKHRREVIASLTKLLKDEKSDIRIAAIKALGRIAKTEFGEVDERYVRYYRGQIAKYDKNGDGVLTEDEWSKMTNDPSSADRNSDGRITPEELTRWGALRGG
jgi:hypothetical protein